GRHHHCPGAAPSGSGRARGSRPRGGPNQDRVPQVSSAAPVATNCRTKYRPRRPEGVQPVRLGRVPQPTLPQRSSGQYRQDTWPVTVSTGTIPPPGSPRWERESADSDRLSPRTKRWSGGTSTSRGVGQGASSSGSQGSATGSPSTTSPPFGVHATTSPPVAATRLR